MIGALLSVVDLSPEAWGTIGGIGGAIAAATGTWAAAKAGGAKAAAQDAARLSAPTSNGFAGDVRAALDDLRHAVARIEHRQLAGEVAARKTGELLAEHLHDHARDHH